MPRDIVAHGAGFREVTRADVADLLQNHRADLSNQELMALEQEQVAGEEDEESCPAPPHASSRPGT